MSPTISGLLNQISRKARELLESREGTAVERLLQRCHELVSSRGEASGLALASDVFEAYAAFDDTERLEFWLATEAQLGVDRSALLGAIDDYQADPEADPVWVHNASEPRRQELFRRLNSAPDGTVSLIRMRESLRGLALPAATAKRIHSDFVHLFSSWFNKGFLELRQISWQTPADVLEKLIRYESVHEIQGWDDLRRRLAKDRRCFGYFHPAMPDEPLIFVEVALVKGMSGAIEPLLSAGEIDPEDADTAVFYSINNCQAGLAQVSFGNFLIKQVVEVMRHTTPQIKTFVTLSPIPGLKRWVDSDPERCARQQAGDEPFVGLCIEYLTSFERGRLIDPVARFHLGNGARLERINLSADSSEAGQSRSFGAMVNYLYEADTIVKNHEALMARGEVAVSPKLKSHRRAPVAALRTET
ncbi:malonyl-CoA decarboxylase [Litorivicinus lipolyticus]|uniref:malonyl-CoA decarboxylase n=1 Tax=Litorivicinus lipolyticus TaxID=418701 RepID=UPI003B58D3F1